MKVGSVVKLKVHCLGNPAGTLGVCYDVYTLDNRPGYGLIFENGNYDGFAPDEVRDCVEEVGFAPQCADYEFRNVMTLTRDFDNGVFKPAFRK